MKHIHIPLADELHGRLLAEARRSGESATGIARTAIEQALGERRRRALSEEISVYARAIAGSENDLDPELEGAATEHLLATR